MFSSDHVGGFNLVVIKTNDIYSGICEKLPNQRFFSLVVPDITTTFVASALMLIFATILCRADIED